jgi:hypothetical protein
MRSLKLVSAVMLAASLSFALARGTLAEPLSFQGEMNLEELLAAAGKTFTLEEEDAIILVSARELSWLPDGRREELTHEVVWIRTDHAIDQYADLRIPYDAAHCDLEVKALRTWRDGRWWEATDTAIVETLPFALASADDYVNMRETMLLHDGVELPCIMETVYVITDKTPFRAGASGLWLFAREDPVVSSTFVLGVPPGVTPSTYHSLGVPEPERATDEARGLDTYRWTMGLVEPLGEPHLDDPAVDAPHVTWSTWGSWAEFGTHLDGVFGRAQELGDVLRDSVAVLGEEAPAGVALARDIADFIARTTRPVRYDEGFWLESPRQASRTYATAYGHRLDRAALAAALFREAGFRVSPVYRSVVCADVDEGVPCLERFEGPDVAISGVGIMAHFDAATAHLSTGATRIFGRTVWFPGMDAKPEVPRPADGRSGALELRLRLKHDSEKNRWTGSGTLATSGVLCAFDEMQGFGSEAEDHLTAVVEGVVAAAAVSGYNPAVFERLSVLSGFECEADLAEKDDFGQIPLVLGDPAGGLLDRLPPDVQANVEKRSSPLLFPGLLAQEVRVTLEAEDLNVVRLPEEVEMENDAGVFRLSVARDEGEITVTRKLALNRATFSAAEWPDVRALLLAERHERNRTLLFTSKK